MEHLALRLILPPLVVVIASLGQRHLGDRFGGLLVGLPLTSGTFMGLLLLSHGPDSVADAAVGVLAGQVAVVVMVAAYAHLSRAGVTAAVAGCIVCWAVAVMAVRSVEGPILCSALFAGVALVALRSWPTSDEPEVDSRRSAGAGEFATRVVLASALVVTLASGVHVLGPQLAGLLSAAPLVALVLTPATHRERGGAAVAVLLHGVARGSVGAATFALVLSLSVGELGGMAFLLATSAGCAVAALISVAATVRPTAGEEVSPAPSAQLVPDTAQVLHE